MKNSKKAKKLGLHNNNMAQSRPQKQQDPLNLFGGIEQQSAIQNNLDHYDNNLSDSDQMQNPFGDLGSDNLLSQMHNNMNQKKTNLKKVAKKPKVRPGQRDPYAEQMQNISADPFADEMLLQNQNELSADPFADQNQNMLSADPFADNMLQQNQNMLASADPFGGFGLPGMSNHPSKAQTNLNSHRAAESRSLLAQQREAARA